MNFGTVASKGISLPIAMRCKGLKISLIKLVLKNIPGALAKASSVIAKYNINILSSILNAPSAGPKATMISFIDYTKSRAPLDVVIEELKDSDVVLDVEVIKPQLPELIVNVLTYPLLCLDVRCILIHITGMSEMLRYLYSRFGSAAKALMYYAGYSSAKGMIGELKKVKEAEKIDILRACLQLFQACGYGRFEILYSKLKPVNILIRAYDLFECEPFRGRMEEANSHFFRGILAGVVEAITGEEVIALEDKCIAKGDPFCQFIITRRIK